MIDQTKNGNLPKWLAPIRTRTFLLALICVLIGGGILARLLFVHTMPNPIASFPIDLSRANAEVDGKFRISEDRSYVIAVWFPFKGTNDLKKLYEILGNGTKTTPGNGVTIQLSVIKLADANQSEESLFNGTVQTHDYYAMQYDPDHYREGTVGREVITIDLQPGEYRITAMSPEDNPAFIGRSGKLSIDYYAQLRFVHNTVQAKPNGEK